MSVSIRHLFQQGPVIRSLVDAAVSTVSQKLRSPQPHQTYPGPWFHATVPPRDARLVVDYIQWTGGDFARYGEDLPPHFFPQWGFPLVSKTLRGIPYPLTGALNQGCKLTIQAPIPKNQPLQLSARLEDIEDDGQRARLHQRLITSTSEHSEALIADIYAVVRLRSGPKQHREKPSTPTQAARIASWGLTEKAGWEFALLTGDFNPIHWIRPAARAAGFKNTILHGFASLALTMERIQTHIDTHNHKPLRSIDVRFVKPLILPNQVTLYLDTTGPSPLSQTDTLGASSDSSDSQTPSTSLYLTDQSGDICMLGQFT